MKYGLLYNRYALNLGDDIQSYAQARFLPRIDYVIDREAIDSFTPKKKEYVATILNAWYQHDLIHFDISPYIYPKFISMYFLEFYYYKHLLKDNLCYFDGDTIEKFKKYGPVGVRDMHTKELFDKLKIPNYFSGCLTLTLERFPNLKKEDYIYAVGLNEEEIAKLKKITKREIRIFKQDYDEPIFKDETWEIRKKRVEEILKEYQKAHMVITTKLHCTLPCLALETPVLLLYQDKHEGRMATFKEYANYINRDDFLKENIDIEHPKKNPSKYKKLRKSLIESCENFIKETDSLSLNVKQLPDIPTFQKMIQSKRERVSMMNDLFEKTNALYIEASTNRDWYHKRLAEVEKENYELKIKNEELTKTVNRFKNSIPYKLARPVYKACFIKKKK